MKSGNDYFQHNEASILRGGKQFFETLIENIRTAKENIHLQTYILSNDHTGRMVAEELKKAASRHVDVFVVADGFASQSLDRQFIEQLKNSNVQFRFFEPWLKSRQYFLGRRLHHKIFTADRNIAIVGGINIADRYNDMPESIAWLDFAVLVKGQIASQVSDYCNSFWQKKVDKSRDVTIDNIQIDPEADCEARLRINDWLWHHNQITASYLEMFRQSRKEIIILCSYFIPGKVMRRLLKHAVGRGVSIKIIMTGQSDFLVSKLAEKWLYDWLLRYGIRLFEYRNGILHGKMAVADREWMTIGSYNINNLSTYASIECNLDIKNNKLATATSLLIESIAEKECDEITKERHQKTKNIFKQFSRWLSYQLLVVILRITTLTMVQKHQ